MKSSRVCLLAALLPLASCAPTLTLPSADLAVTGVTLIDGNGGPAVPGQTVLIAERRIAAIAPAERVEIPSDARVIDGRGRFLIPGLWDMHVHAWGPSPFSELFLSHGITAVREMGTGIEPQWGGPAGVWDWRAAVRSGEMPGPRVFAAGFILNGGDPDGQGAVFFKGAPGPEEGRDWVDTLADRGADFIKIYSALAPETFEAISVRARERGLTLAGHVPARVGTRAAVAGGLRSLEHLYDFLVAASSAEEQIRTEIEREILESEMPTAAAQLAERARTDRLLASYDPQKASELFALFRSQGTWIEPTLMVNADPRCAGSPLPPLDAESLADLPGFLHRFVEQQEIEPEELDRDCRRAAKLSKVVAQLERHGVRLLAGSDSPNPGVKPGAGLHDELFLLVRAGLTPARALQVATRDAAEFMGLGASLGTIEEGRIADLVLLEADPLSDIRNTRRIAAVIANGEVVHEDSDQTSEAAR